MQFTGSIVDYAVVFTSGVLVSFTPCIYPVIPITASFIAGANTSGRKSHGLALSMIYVLGMAIVYCAMAVIAALTGKIFGQLQNTSIAYFLIAGGLVFFGLVMLDKIQLPSFSFGNAHRVKVDSLWSVLLFGMLAGLIVGPCTAPVLGSLLFYIAAKENMIHGISLMFVFAYGVGFSLILVGTFSGLISRLPKSGAWLIRIKQICGVILLAIGVFFIYKGFRSFH